MSWMDSENLYSELSVDVCCCSIPISGVYQFGFATAGTNISVFEWNQGNTDETERGCGHTIKSHGLSVARIHIHDWIILLLLVVIYIVLNVIGPFHRFVGKDMMTDLKYPMKDNTVPGWSVPVRIPADYTCKIQ